MCFHFLLNSTHSYSKICGQVAEYQHGSPDAFYSGNTDINKPYVDGVSITQESPRQHVWTYVIALHEILYYLNNPYPGNEFCPCSANSTQQVYTWNSW